MPRLSKPLYLVLVIACLALLVLVQLLRAGGVFRTVAYGFPGSCRAIELGGRTRDIRVDRERGLAYLSLQDAATGTVLLLDLNLATPAPRAAMSYDPQGFRPTGISLLKQSGLPARLFAVSDVEGGVPAVEISEQDAGGAFVPRQTVRDPAIDRPSLVAAVGPAQFYVLNHRPPRGTWQQQTRLLMRSGDDSIAYYDGAKATVLVKDLAWASGLAVSPDGSHLYVTELLTQSLRVYRRNTGTAELALERVVPLGSAPGNLDVDAEGVLWMAAHPKLQRYFAAQDHAREVVPSQVLRFDPRQADSRPAQVFADDGTMISAAITTAHWRQELLMGALFDKKVLICKTAP